MRYEKNFTGIISVFIKLSKIRKDFELILVGEVPDDVKQLIKYASKFFTIKAIGLLKNIEVAYQLQQSNCMVMFSKTENFPCVIVESLCCGVPVITSNVGGAAEAINESNGIVVQSEDELSLLSAFQNIMTNYSLYNPEQIAFEAAKLYSGSNIANKFIDIYQRLKLI
jgi:glycosyltransferase involved in cell wall biosynthesis